ncbi:flagellar FlbD family protein [Candidatus Blastococcus massiliensis]|uniref:flagellar FlbD family protein n=1 Tax=Candidatus Blastococcus massiliensis TaxID=1470358 RepID=UPI0004AC7CC4|nr:flagellar FlbD family protein [Candidatus Blastococcus massiliensis]
MIAVTCRNGEHFTIDPSMIERIETAHDTVVHTVDRRTYVVAMGFEDLLRTIRDHHAALLVVRKRLAGGTAEIADHASTVREQTLRVERRAYSRDGDHPGSPADRRPVPGATDDGTPPNA